VVASSVIAAANSISYAPTDAVDDIHYSGNKHIADYRLRLRWLQW
jgi:hypothetical protein